MCVTIPHTFGGAVSNKLTMCFSKKSGSELDELTTPDGGHTPLNRILISLQVNRRRYLLYYLQEEDSCDLDDAAQHVAAWEQGCDLSDVPPKIHDRIQMELYHIHLPKLEQLNIIDYDKRSGGIRLRDPPDKLDAFLELARAEDELD